MTTTGFLHPGAMGAAVAMACSGDRVWAGSGRSRATRRRAEEAGLVDVGTVVDMAAAADLIVSVCPPAEAHRVAQEAAATGFEGTYLDANAISPDRARSIAGLFDEQATFVDGGIIGPPPLQSDTTRLYLSGPLAQGVAARWRGSVLGVRPISADIGAASALKMAYAAWTKGSAALLLAVNALAVANGVEEELVGEWSISQPDAQRRTELLPMVAAKAWRFAGEMDEIAETFSAARLPDGFHRAASTVYVDLAEFKDVTTSPDIDELIAALLR